MMIWLEMAVVLEEDTELVGSSRLDDLDNAVMHIRLNGCLCKDGSQQTESVGQFLWLGEYNALYCDLHCLIPDDG